MAFVIRLFSSIFAILLGLPLLLSSLFQTVFTVGYDERNVEETAKNYLSGSSSFIDEAQSNYWSVGYGSNILTPDDITEKRYFLGGFLKFPAQEATEALDDLTVRAVCLDDNSGRGAAAFAWIDCVGFMNADVKAVREKLSDITGDGKLISIDIGATHIHSGIDTQGLWGNIPKSGRDEKYIESVIEKTADAIRTAYNQRTEGELYYSAEPRPEFFWDGRAPYVSDGKFHLLRFVPNDSAKREIYIANFGAHGVNLDWEDTRMSADFPYYIEQKINAEQNADFIFIQGAIGGGINCHMSAENGVNQDQDGYGKMKEFSSIIADIYIDLAKNGEKVEPVLNVVHKQIDVEVNGFLFKLVERSGMCNVKAFKEDGKAMFATEIGYIEIGKNIKIVQVPGEILPEIAYGGILSAEESSNKTEYPYPALNTYFSEDDTLLVFGLCNDALGYIVPDNDYVADNSEGHYEETISTGSHTASSVSKGFAELFDEVL